MLSIRPDRLSLTHLVRRLTLNDFFKSPISGQEFEKVSEAQISVVPKTKTSVTKKFHNFNISVNSQRNLKDKISYLFQFAKSRSIKTYSGKTLPNFKICFLTLTLPSAQVHPTAEINKLCLEPFLEVLRKRLKMQNYVWRMEFQANGNVHYHLATDTYIDYFFAQKHWNNIINTLGYVARYAQKMDKMPYTQYLRNYSNNGAISPDIVYKRWVKGKASKWQHPNTVDVKNAKSSDSIGYYISKYFSKKEKGAKQNPLDNESNSYGLRLCFWSRSLSRCKAEAMPVDYYDYNFVKIFEQCENVLAKSFDYCKVFYFSFNQLPARVRSLIGAFFNAMRVEIEYIPAS